MKIGVLSDTHIPKNAFELPEKLLEALSDCDMIIHAGDMVEKEVSDQLQAIAPLKAVAGNMDDPYIRSIFPQKQIIKIGNFRIGVIHGFGSPKKIVETVKNEFDETIDVIVFGHSHCAMNTVIGKTLFFNPGSPTDKLFAKYNSYGVLRIGDTIKGEIIKI
ncbi:MAG: metallophosphoesterase family protein [Candidatus Omnitrophica bacterium]|jgi:hypothetical protein|nr:metallophosphoesterase family protein [Candidatus Omnitrophota bacterium]